MSYTCKSNKKCTKTAVNLKHSFSFQAILKSGLSKYATLFKTEKVELFGCKNVEVVFRIC